jgi:hypothetical protein
MRDNDILLQRLYDRDLSDSLPRNSTDLTFDRYYDAGVMRKDQLVDGGYYFGVCRNSSVAKWDVNNDCFQYMRYKWGRNFLDTIKYMTDDDHYDVFMPFEKIDGNLEEDEIVK